MTNLSFDVFWRDHGASQGMQKLGTDTKKAHGEVEHLSGLAPKLGAAFGALIGVEVFSEFIRGARDAAAQTRITENVIRTTGGAAHVTAKDVEELALSISNKSGVDDDAVRSGANLLLTFTGIRNEAGKGNDIFNRTTGAVIDMAAAMNGGKVTTDGVKAASIQLGKALNDPIKGLTALRRVGVSFTDQQQTQIKALVKSGHTLEAQKIILDEVGKEFGGTAAAAADPMQKLQVIAENLGKQIGGALLPAVNDFASFMANTGAPAIAGFVNVLTGIPAPAYAVAAGLAGVVVAARGAVKVTEAYHDVLKQGSKVIDFFVARATATAAAETAQATAAGAAAGAETAHARASGAAAVATGEVAAASEAAAGAETAQAGAADVAAASTGRLGLAAQGAGTMLGTLAGKAMLAGGIGGLAYLSAQITSWQGTAEVTGVKTNELADALTHLAANAHAPKAALDAVTTSGERYWSSVETGNDVMKQFGALAKGAFGDGLQDIIGRAQTGSERMDRFAATASQLDGALTAMVQSGHAKEAAAFLATVKTESGLADAEFVHVTNHLPGYTAAIGSAGSATSETAGAAKDLATSTAQAKAAADAHTKALKDEITNLTAATDAFLGGRAAARAVKDAQDALTKSIHDNGRGLSDNTAKGRANAAALDDVADKTRKDLQAKIDAGMPMAKFSAAVANSRKKLIDEAEAAGMTKTAAKKYADQILKVPTKQITNFYQPGLAGAKKAVDAVNTAIKNLGGKNVVLGFNAAGNLVERIGSGPMKNKPLFSAGGYTGPGGKHEPAGIVHAGEFVIPAAATSRLGVPFLGALAGLPGYARGGPVVSIQGRGRLGQQRGGLNAWENAMLLATGRAASQFGGGAIPAGSGVARWGPMVRRALQVLGLAGDPFVFGRVMRQIGTESGGNPNALQMVHDVNWPNNRAQGLLQVIPPTFRANHWPGTSWNEYDPWANILAALNYARKRYGPSLYALGNGHGYAAGTSSATPGWRWVGENGPELVRFRGGERVLSNRMSTASAGGTVQVNITIDGTAAGLEDRIVGAARSAVRHGRLARAVLP